MQENDAEVEKAAKDAVAAVRRERPDLKDDLEKIAQVSNAALYCGTERVG